MLKTDNEQAVLQSIAEGYNCYIKCHYPKSSGVYKLV